MRWAIHDAPVDDAAVLMVLIAICERTDDAGRNAYPSMSWVADRARCSVRTAHRRLAVLRKEGLVLDGDQSLVATFRADRRPSVFDVDLTRTRGMSDPTRRESGWDDSTRTPGDTDDMSDLTRRDTDDMSQASRRDMDDTSSATDREPRHVTSGIHGMSPVADNRPIPPTEVKQKEGNGSDVPAQSTDGTPDGAPDALFDESAQAKPARKARAAKKASAENPHEELARQITGEYLSYVTKRRGKKPVDRDKFFQAVWKNYVLPALDADRTVNEIKNALSRCSDAGQDWPTPQKWRQEIDNLAPRTPRARAERTPEPGKQRVPETW